MINGAVYGSLHCQPVEDGADTYEESIAVSLRRIADALEQLVGEILDDGDAEVKGFVVMGE